MAAWHSGTCGVSVRGPIIWTTSAVVVKKGRYLQRVIWNPKLGSCLHCPLEEHLLIDCCFLLAICSCVSSCLFWMSSQAFWTLKRGKREEQVWVEVGKKRKWNTTCFRRGEHRAKQLRLPWGMLVHVKQARKWAMTSSAEATCSL